MTPVKQTGFTLLELLTVVFVIGLISTFIVVNIERDSGKLALLEAKRFASLLAHIQDESILQGAPMGIDIDLLENSYQFQIYQSNWKLIEEDNILRARSIPETLEIDFRALSKNKDAQGGISDQGNDSDQGDNEKQPDDIPEIIVDPYGLTSPFSMTFEAESRVYEVRSDHNQEILIAEKK